MDLKFSTDGAIAACECCGVISSHRAGDVHEEMGDLWSVNVLLGLDASQHDEMIGASGDDHDGRDAVGGHDAHVTPDTVGGSDDENDVPDSVGGQDDDDVEKDDRSADVEQWSRS